MTCCDVTTVAPHHAAQVENLCYSKPNWDVVVCEQETHASTSHVSVVAGLEQYD
jgi:hypothetical protein